jgi:hypothetical protein
MRVGKIYQIAVPGPVPKSSIVVGSKFGNLVFNYEIR